MADRDRPDRDRDRRRKRQRPKRSKRGRSRLILPGSAGYTIPGGYPVPMGQPIAPPPQPGTTGMEYPPPQDTTASWAPPGERHAVTTNQEPEASWPPVDLPVLSGFTTQDVPQDQGQDNPETIYNQPAVMDEASYNDYNQPGA